MSNVIFEYLGHEAINSTTHVCQQHQNVRAIVFRGEGAFDGIDLSANEFDTSN
ncbi:hypothetical protein HDF17_002171 [Granulicella arctica]|uniref:Uncharacterized protein n=1 Tax=Granulicella arctica TaxID=940613 RepID=A0A7Y9PIN9_9BACT|nr:hypothetical protein [Granulicella arctica]